MPLRFPTFLSRLYQHPVSPLSPLLKFLYKQSLNISTILIKHKMLQRSSHCPRRGVCLPAEGRGVVVDGSVVVDVVYDEVCHASVEDLVFAGLVAGAVGDETGGGGKGREGGGRGVRLCLCARVLLFWDAAFVVLLLTSRSPSRRSLYSSQQPVPPLDL